MIFRLSLLRSVPSYEGGLRRTLHKLSVSFSKMSAILHFGFTFRRSSRPLAAHSVSLRLRFRFDYFQSLSVDFDHFCR